MMGFRSWPFRRFFPPLPFAACATCLALLMAAFLMSLLFMVRRRRLSSSSSSWFGVPRHAHGCYNTEYKGEKAQALGRRGVGIGGRAERANAIRNSRLRGARKNESSR
ncbi:uncharacterized protein EI97DRAFT_117587 [Westerdykella ornata]|uniref:Uncharacterized protein n=1 Tax=Westerdykella ornata TaxID=318751 RepID=A0A6A6JZ07_WESOR|nr:uncharacterized protein EI97DRAFT_117587 [Westerdykella ornata]KAF2280279.1 hypothetical protein EI97DRAFT_117587 [Westerdykella ornata]